MQNQFKKLTCASCRAMLFDYVSDAISPQQRLEVKKHVDSCPSCSQELQEIQHMLDLLEQMPEPVFPKDFAQTLHLKLVDTAIQSSQAKSGWKNVGRWFRHFVKNGTWKIIAPALLCTVLVIGVFSSGLYQKWKNSDDILNVAPMATTQNDSGEQDNVENITPTPSSPVEMDAVDGSQQKERETLSIPSKTAEAHVRNTERPSAFKTFEPGTTTKPEHTASAVKEYEESGTSKTEHSGNISDPFTTQIPETAETDQGVSASAEPPASSASNSALNTEDLSPQEKQDPTGVLRSVAPEADEVFADEPAPTSEDKNDRLSEKSNTDQSAFYASTPSMTADYVGDEKVSSAASAASGGGSGGSASSIAGGSVDSPAVYHALVNDLEEFALDYGIDVSGSTVTLTVSSDEWPELKACILSHGGTLSKVSSGTGSRGLVQVTISQ